MFLPSYTSSHSSYSRYLLIYVLTLPTYSSMFLPSYTSSHSSYSRYLLIYVLTLPVLPLSCLCFISASNPPPTAPPNPTPNLGGPLGGVRSVGFGSSLLFSSLLSELLAGGSGALLSLAPAVAVLSRGWGTGLSTVPVVVRSRAWTNGLGPRRSLPPGGTFSLGDSALLSDDALCRTGSGLSWGVEFSRM